MSSPVSNHLAYQDPYLILVSVGHFIPNYPQITQPAGLPKTLQLAGCHLPLLLTSPYSTKHTPILWVTLTPSQPGSPTASPPKANGMIIHKRALEVFIVCLLH